MGQSPAQLAATFTDATVDATGRSYIPGNTLDILENGDEIFPAMLEAIAAAQSTIDFTTYVYWRSDIANQFADALIGRAVTGVRVRLLVDAVGGAIMDSRTLWRLERAGVQVAWFRPVRWPYLHKFNNRTHRKILIVDGAIGFTGGVGIAAEWTGHAQDLKHWRETHCRIVGPACAALHAGFLENWNESTRYRGPAEVYPPAPSPASAKVAVSTVISTARNRKPTEIDRLFTTVFDTARHSLNITTAYFVPSPEVIASLAAAAARGVRVRVLTNGPASNHKVTRLAGRGSYQALLEAGVVIAEYQPTVLHAKVITADGVWATLGSANLDARSLVLNDELNVAVADVHVTTALDRTFEGDMAKSTVITPEMWAKRSIVDHVSEAFAGVVRSQL